MDLGLKGKNVIITGGGSNIGRAIVLGFAREGANIVIADIDEKQAAKVADKAKEMVTLLSNTLRYALQTAQKRTVSMESELQVVNDYLGLESIRLEDRLKINMDIGPETLRTAVPPMIMQILVENAIKHGIAKLPYGGEISVKTEKNGGFLIIEVINDGVLQMGEGSPGVGLRNALSRLRTIYGDNVRFNLSNVRRDKVLAKIYIPWEGENRESIDSG